MFFALWDITTNFSDTMSNHSHLVLPQSTTTAQTPQPSTPTSTATRSQSPIQNEIKQRLELYNSLFEQGTNNRCDETELQLKESLNYSLYTFFLLSDINWVLAVVDIADLETFDEKYGHQLATVIKQFCDNDPRKLKGYKYNNDGDLLALLMYCHPKLIKSEKYISKLVKKIKQQTIESVFVGIAKMNDWETYDEWKQRAMKNVTRAKNTIDEKQQQPDEQNWKRGVVAAQLGTLF